MERLRFIEHAGKKLLFMDCSSNTKEEGYAIFDDFEALLKQQPEKSVLLFCDFENCYHDSVILGRWKKASPEHQRYIKKAACVGVSGGFKIAMAAYRFFARFSGIDIDTIMHIFNEESDAKNWLVE